MQQLDVAAPAPRVPTLPRRWLQAIATAACTGIVIVVPKSISPWIKVPLILLGTLSAIDLSRREARNPGDPRPIVWTIGGLFTLAVATTPKFATDIWSYTMIGRIFAVHHLNPYRVAPAAVGHDPLLPLLHLTWRGGTTPYGPLSVAHASLVALIAGTHPLLYRLAFQLTAAAAIAAALWLLWRSSQSTAALALVGLHPMVAGSIVNGGHNDAAVALGLVAVVLLLARGRLHAAAWILAVTVLVKLTIAYAIVPIAVWTAVRYGWRGLRTLVVPTLLAGIVMAIIPGAIHSVTSANSGVVTRLAVWNLPIRVRWLSIHSLHAANYTTLGLVVIAAVIAYAAIANRNQPDPGRGAAIGAAAWVAAAGYVLAWYTVLGLVVAALRPTERLARWLAVQGGVITAAYLVPSRYLASNALVGDTVQLYVPLALTVAFVWALIERRTSPIPTA